MKGIEILPRRWIVEASRGLLIQSRRLIRDLEVRVEHAEVLVYLFMTKRMLARIAAWAFSAGRQGLPRSGVVARGQMET